MAKKYQIFGKFPSEGDGSDLPSVTDADNGKILRVVDGEWAAGELDSYTGTYVITPGSSTTVLNTSKKMMGSNIIVEQIPYAEVDNPAGGKTVTIGSEE
jgi:hypothetical protein